MAPKLSKDLTEMLLFETSYKSGAAAEYDGSGGDVECECCGGAFVPKRSGRSAVGVRAEEKVGECVANGVPPVVVIVGTSGERIRTGSVVL